MKTIKLNRHSFWTWHHEKRLTINSKGECWMWRACVVAAHFRENTWAHNICHGSNVHDLVFNLSSICIRIRSPQLNRQYKRDHDWNNYIIFRLKTKDRIKFVFIFRCVTTCTFIWNDDKTLSSLAFSFQNFRFFSYFFFQFLYARIIVVIIE